MTAQASIAAHRSAASLAHSGCAAVGSHPARPRCARSSSGGGQAGPTARSCAGRASPCRPTRPQRATRLWTSDAPSRCSSPSDATPHALPPAPASSQRGGRTRSHESGRNPHDHLGAQRASPRPPTSARRMTRRRGCPGPGLPRLARRRRWGGSTPSARSLRQARAAAAIRSGRPLSRAGSGRSHRRRCGRCPCGAPSRCRDCPTRRATRGPGRG
jgi:hypothetical protein